ncbi:MAG: PD-(D/E)XK nuclease family protein, partial [Crocinitomicaceae bacterium]|nr:PD-(D/E)XK nuclease family protein [Crocinitomicaceae bacterium]
MTTFLQEQVRLIFDRHKGHIQDISIIIPNRRAAVYLQKYLAKEFGRAYFSPEILTIHDWINSNTPERILSSTELLFVLYEVHCEIINSDKELFENFMLWGKTILTDFDEIDRYMKSPEEVFQNLRNIKELESWNVEPDEMGPEQIKFNEFWGKLSEYYAKLELRLKALDATYAGRAYLNFYNNIAQHSLKDKIYFLGFNAVSEVEKQIMKYLQDEKIAEVIFDVDRFYFENEEHEAGYFYHQIVHDWKIQPDLSNNFNSIPKQFEVIETSQQTGQAKIAGFLVEQLLKNGEHPKDIAVVLADESLLIPLTKSLPAEVETANITMGWPIKFSHLRGFLDTLFEFQFNFEKFKSEELYHKTLITFLQHPYTQEILGDYNAKEKLQRTITEGNKIFVEWSQLEVLLPGVKNLQFLLRPLKEDNIERIRIFEKMVDLLYATFNEVENRSIDLEIIYQFNKGLKKFSDILKKYSVEMSLQSFKSMFFQFWQNESLSFFGNPTDGLQVMGILETRTIDFKNLIIIGMNEGNLPKPTQVNSFIPRDLRQNLNLPIEEDRQAIFAHHFYRLLHRASNVFMAYNSNSEGIGSGEASRYITQLENELDSSIHSFKRYTFTGDDTASNSVETVYYSTPEVQKRLDEILESGLSPSALNKLVTCPLDFYYRYILKFEESDEVEENIESSTFGTKIHTVLQQIIQQNFSNGDEFKPLEIERLKKEKVAKKIQQRLTDAYLQDDGGKKFSKSDLKYGQNKLSFDVSERFIYSFLEEQINDLKKSKEDVIHIKLEENIEAEIETTLNG